MIELIDRQAALDVLCDACGNCACPKGKIPRCSYYEKMQAIPTASPWHRVEEEPKDNTWCVFVSENKHNFEQYRWIGTYSKEWGFQDDDRFMVGNVKYWMPLPEPPKEEAWNECGRTGKYGERREG